MTNGSNGIKKDKKTPYVDDLHLLDPPKQVQSKQMRSKKAQEDKREESTQQEIQKIRINHYDYHIQKNIQQKTRANIQNYLERKFCDKQSGNLNKTSNNLKKHKFHVANFGTKQQNSDNQDQYNKFKCSKKQQPQYNVNNISDIDEEQEEDDINDTDEEDLSLNHITAKEDEICLVFQRNKASKLHSQVYKQRQGYKDVHMKNHSQKKCNDMSSLIVQFQEKFNQIGFNLQIDSQKQEVVINILNEPNKSQIYRYSQIKTLEEYDTLLENVLTSIQFPISY